MRWLLALLICSSTAVAANTLELRLDCEVKYQTIVSSEDGIPKVYSGYKDGLETGDNVTVKLRANKFSKDLYFEAVDTKRQIILTNHTTSYGEPGRLLEGELRHTSGPGLLSISQDLIIVNSFFSDIKFERYYKSDFEGMYVNRLWGALTTQVMTFDCRTVKNELAEIQNLFR